MYENIGEKIKKLAKGCFIVESIAVIIAGLGILITVEDMGALLVPLLIIFGLFGAYASTWVLYGFGQLVENTDIIVSNLSNKQLESNTTSNSMQVQNKKSNTAITEKDKILTKWEKEGLITKDDYHL